MSRTETFFGKTAKQIQALLYPMAAALTNILKTQNANISAADAAIQHGNSSLLTQKQKDQIKKEAEKLDKPHQKAVEAVDKAHKKVTDELEKQKTAFAAIRADIENLTTKINDPSLNKTEKANAQTRSDALKKQITEPDLDKAVHDINAADAAFIKAKKDHPPQMKADPTSGRIYSVDSEEMAAARSKLETLKSQNPIASRIAALQTHAEKLEAQQKALDENKNPTSDACQKACVEAHTAAISATKTTEAMTAQHPISPTSYSDQGIDTRPLEKALKEYESNPDIHSELSALKTYTEQVNEQLVALKELESKIVDEATFEAYQSQYKTALNKLDETLGNIAKSTNTLDVRFGALRDKSGASLSLQEVANKIPEDTANKVPSFAKMFNNLRELDKEVNARKRAFEKEASFTGAITGRFKQALAVIKGISRTYRTEEDRPTIPRLHDKNDVNSLEFSKEFGLTAYKQGADGKMQSYSPTDKHGNQIKPTMAELMDAVREFNEKHKNDKPPVQIKLKKNMFGDGYTIDCKKPEFKEAMINILKAKQENRIEKEQTAKVTEKTESTEAKVAEATGKSVDAAGKEAPKTEAEAGATISKPGK